MTQLRHDSLIFDLDGTLWDSSRACALGWTEGVQEVLPTKKVFTARELGRIMGLTFEEAVKVLVPETPESDLRRVGEHCYKKEIEAIQRHGASLYPGVAEGLVELAQAYPLYLVSNCLEDYLLLFLHSSALGQLFKDSECHGRTGKGKAENIASLMKKNHLRSPAYIGDTSGDQRASLQAGAVYYHVNYGFGTPSAPCLRFGSFSELTNHFLQAGT